MYEPVACTHVAQWHISALFEAVLELLICSASADVVMMASDTEGIAHMELERALGVIGDVVDNEQGLQGFLVVSLCTPCHVCFNFGRIRTQGFGITVMIVYNVWYFVCALYLHNISLIYVCTANRELSTPSDGVSMHTSYNKASICIKGRIRIETVLSLLDGP